MADTSLVFNLLAKDKVSGKLGGIRRNFDRMSMAIVGGAAAAGAGLVKVGQDFDEAFNTIQTGTGATGQAMQALKDDFKAALSETPADMQEVSSALADLNTTTGATGQTLQELTVNVTEASRVLGEDGAANAEAFGQALSQWQVPAAQGTDKLDQLFVATQDYGVGLGEVIGQLNEYGSVLQNAGFTMSESAALFGELESSGLSVSRVMPGLNMAFRNWAEEGKNVQAQLNSTVDEIANAENSTEALAVATEEFGAEGAQRLVTAVRSGALSLEDLSGALDGSQGAVSRAAEANQTLTDRLNELKNEALVGLEPLAMSFIDALETGVGVLSDVHHWASENKNTVKTLGIVLGIAAGAVVAFSIVARVHAGVMAVMRGATLLAAGAQWILNAAMAANPIGLVVLAVAALVAIFIIAWQRSETFRNIVTGALDAVKNAAQAVWDFFSGPFVGFFTGIPGFFQGLWNRVVAIVLSAALRLATGATRRFVQFISFVRSIPGRALDALGNLGSLLYNAGQNIIQGLIDGIRSMIGAVGDAASSAAQAVRDVWPFSPAKEGPLAGAGDPTLAGRRIAEMIAGGMAEGTDEVSRAAAAVAGETQPERERAATRAPAAGGRRGRDQVTVRLNVDGADEDMKRMIRKMVRVEGGGDVQVAFG